ncbi:MAG: ABC transporter ATP-binding protein [Bacteroidota bacterium]
MRSLTLKVENVARVFARKTLFEGITFKISSGQSFAVTGKNGSGKSTLVKILCGLMTSSRGTIQYTVDNAVVPIDELFPHIGLVSPYLNMYDEFSGEENLQLFAKIRGIPVDQKYIDELLQRCTIYEHRKKEVRYYSSGMKQRLKYCAALLHRPVLLYLDEPSANLDEQGIGVVREVMQEQKQNGSLIFATNDELDLKYADSILDLNSLKIG